MAVSINNSFNFESMSIRCMIILHGFKDTFLEHASILLGVSRIFLPANADVEGFLRL